jgi:hypothetical protein
MLAGFYSRRTHLCDCITRPTKQNSRECRRRYGVKPVVTTQHATYLASLTPSHATPSSMGMRFMRSTCHANPPHRAPHTLHHVMMSTAPISRHPETILCRFQNVSTEVKEARKNSIMMCTNIRTGARDSVVGGGTMLRDGRSRV